MQTSLDCSDAPLPPKLTLYVGEILYTIQPRPWHHGWKALHLCAPGGRVEAVTLAPDGWTFCTCLEFGVGVSCAHLRALFAAAIFDSENPKPVEWLVGRTKYATDGASLRYHP